MPAIAVVPARKFETDSGLKRGKTYHYVVTAVDGSGRGSVYSRQAFARAK